LGLFMIRQSLQPHGQEKSRGVPEAFRPLELRAHIYIEKRF